MITEEHFIDCHPEDEEAPATPEGYEPAETEKCWHCAAPTKKGCNCADCWESDIPPSGIYHCAVCGRYWAYMQLNVTTITLKGAEA